MKPLLPAATLYACQCHISESLEGDNLLPYFYHVAEVVMLVRRVGEIESDFILSAAALHDVVECDPSRSSEIKLKFGTRVHALVLELTRTEPSPEQVAALTPSDLKTLRSDLLLKDIEGMTWSAQTVKLADRISNLREKSKVRTGSKLKRYLDQTDQILSIIRREVNPGLWDLLTSEFAASK